MLLAPEQHVVLDSDKVRGRELARGALQHYLEMRTYTTNWRRLGFTDDDLAEAGATVSWRVSSR